MTVRVVMRSFGGENRKQRPAYYSKLLTLASVVRAAERAGVEVVYVNDGPIPEDRRRLMERTGELVPIPHGPVGMRNSYRFALDLATGRGWDERDVVCFVEDDYLFTEDALQLQVAAATAMPDVDYFALYGSLPGEDPAHPEEEGLPPWWDPMPARTVAGRQWRGLASTTSTFSGRVGALRADRGIFEQCMFPFRNRFLDHETCLIYQGMPPYTGRQIFTGLADEWDHRRLRGLARTASLVPVRVALNARGWSRRRRPHHLFGIEPNVACHLTDGVIAPGRDWAAEAESVRGWLEQRQRPVEEALEAG